MLRNFWENENVVSVESGPQKIEDQIAMKDVEPSLKYENGGYQVEIPWINNDPTIYNNYDMALRLENIVKRLKQVELRVGFRR